MSFFRVSADDNVPYEVAWFHEGRPLDPTASHRVDVGDSGRSLRIAEARASDAGEYTCEVRSDGGNDRSVTMTRRWKGRM